MALDSACIGLEGSLQHLQRAWLISCDPACLKVWLETQVVMLVGSGSHTTEARTQPDF
jgi:hypothetical protein